MLWKEKMGMVIGLGGWHRRVGWKLCRKVRLFPIATFDD